jgi:hypothetical protein
MSFLDDDDEPISNTAVDDYICQAQDAYFDGNLNAVIEACQNALKISPRENDAYDLLTVGTIEFINNIYLKIFGN